MFVNMLAYYLLKYLSARPCVFHRLPFSLPFSSRNRVLSPTGQPTCDLWLDRRIDVERIRQVLLGLRNFYHKGEEQKRPIATCRLLASWPGRNRLRLLSAVPNFVLP